MRDFIEYLHAHGGRSLDAEEIADILWLATYVPLPEGDGTRLWNDSGTNTISDGSGQEEQQPVSSAQRSSSQQEDEVRTDAYFPSSQSEDSEGPGVASLPFRSPSVSALPQRLALGRALRPLKRTAPSSTRFVLDEAATVQRIADEGNWLPVLRPARERWLDLVLLADESPSMTIWYEMIGELQALMEQSGAFRTVQRWGYYADPERPDDIHVYAGSRFWEEKPRRRRPEELNDPRGRRLILLVSDCISAAWRQPAINDLLTSWKDTPVTLVQTLPERQWGRTGLRFGTEVSLRSPQPGLPNSNLLAQPRHLLENDHLSPGTFLPVVTLEPELLALWSRGLTAKGNAWMLGVLFPQLAIEPSVPPRQTNGQAAPEAQRVLNRFRKMASDEALRLAGYLSALPLNLPVMRLAQQVMFDNPSQTHLAEVFLSGLVQRKPDQARQTHPEAVEYDFIDGARELLRRSAGERDLLMVLSRISTFVDDNSGLPVDFPTLLADPSRANSLHIDEKSLPFASITAETLRRMGGAFGRLAENLAARIGGDIPLLVASSSNTVTDSSGKRTWYKMDLHLHTPASGDYEQPKATYLEWLQAADAKGLDIVAITDHNTVAGVAAMRREIVWLTRLEEQKRLTDTERTQLAEWRRLTDKILVLPGFEFTAALGFHILGIFPPETSIRQLEYVLLSLNVPADKLDAGSTETGSSTDVLTAYRTIVEAGGMAIAAHANSTHGVAMRNFPFSGQTKMSYTQDPNLIAIEVTDLESRDYRATRRFFNGSKPEYPRKMHCIQGSNAHRITADPDNPKSLGIGDRATEVLLAEPSFKELVALFESKQFDRTRPSFQEGIGSGRATVKDIVSIEPATKGKSSIDSTFQKVENDSRERELLEAIFGGLDDESSEVQSAEIGSLDDPVERDDESFFSFGPRPKNPDTSKSDTPSDTGPFKPSPNRIGLWGMYGSGKTTYITMLYFSRNERWKVLVDQGNEGHIRNSIRIDDPLSFLKSAYSELIYSRVYPQPTPPDKINLFHFHLMCADDSGVPKRYELDFLDASGESFRWPTRREGERFDRQIRPIDLLKTCGRMIYILDPQPLLSVDSVEVDSTTPDKYRMLSIDRRAYFEDFILLLEELRRNELHMDVKSSSLRSYKIAFCVFKADIPAVWQYRNNISEFAEKILGRDILYEIRRYIPKANMKWFAVSATGPRIVNGRVQSATVEGGRIHPDHMVEPYGLFEPIEWLTGTDEEENSV